MSILDAVFETVSRGLPKAGIDYLLIGGFAVNYYGYTRSTLDVDFMIASERVDGVRKIMREAGFTNVDIQENVAFFSAPDGGPRIDFLRVDKSTMQRLMKGATAVSFHGCDLQIPSLTDLIAMKIFALSQNTARRMGKDLPDISYMIVINDLDVERDIKPLCDTFGTPEVFDLIRDQVMGIKDS